MKRFLLLALILLPLLLPAKRNIQHLQFLLEMPTIDKKSVIIDYGSFVVSFNTKYLIPKWVAYELTSEESDGPFARKGKEFRQDGSIKYRQASSSDYRKSGWSRGHLAPAADFKWSDDEMWDTFYFTNCAPQNIKLNNGPWATLEKKARETAKKYGRVWIVTGTFLKSRKPQTIGSNRVAVPDAFYKAMLIFDGKNYHAIAFLFDNDENYSNHQSAALSIDDLEELVGIDFFHNLDDGVESKVESNYSLRVWGY